MALGIPNIASAGVAIRPDLGGFQRQMKRALPAAMAPAIGAAAGLLGAGLAAAVGAGTVFGGFETQMQRIVGLVGISQDEVDKMGESLKQLGPAVGQGPEKLAEALFFVTSAGLRGADALSVVEAAAKASAAGLGDMVDVADAATSAMNAFGSEALNAEAATDVLVATVREGKVEAGSLAGAIGRVIPIAAEAGVSFNEVGAAIAGMTRTGLDANEAVTALRGIINTIVSPSAQAREALDSVGLSANDLRQSLAEDGLLATMQLLSNTFGDNKDAMQAIIPNVRAAAGFFSLMGENVDETIGIFGRMNDITGITDDAFGAVSDTVEFKFAQALATIQTRLTTLGAEVAPVLIEAVDALATAAVEALPALVDLGIVVLNVASGADSAILNFRKLFAGLSALKGSFTTALGIEPEDVQILDEVMVSLIQSVQRGEDPVLAFANSAVALAQEINELGSGVGLTALGFGELNSITNLSPTQLGLVGAEMIRLTRSGQDLGIPMDRILELFGDLPGVMDAYLGPAQLMIIKTQDIRDAVLDGNSAMTKLPGAAGKAAAGLGDIEESADAAREALEELNSEIRGMTDPLFAVVSGLVGYEDELEQAREDGEITDEEFFNLGRSALGLALDMEAANVDFGAAVAGIAVATRSSTDEVIERLENLGFVVGPLGNIISSGITDGIVDGFDGLAEDAAARLQAEMVEALRILGIDQEIQSPSRLWAREIGLPIAQGIAQGLLEGSLAVQSAFEATIPSIAGTGSAGAVTSNVDITFNNPTSHDATEDARRAIGVLQTGGFQ